MPRRNQRCFSRHRNAVHYKEQAEAFDILWQVLFGPQVVELTTVVRTRFEKFNDPTAVREDKAVLQRKTGAAKRILSHIGDRLLYVDNNKDKRKALKESGSIMLKYLIGAQLQERFPPTNYGRREEEDFGAR